MEGFFSSRINVTLRYSLAKSLLNQNHMLRSLSLYRYIFIILYFHIPIFVCMVLLGLGC